MDAKGGKSNEFERRVSLRNSVRVSVANGGDEDDFDFGAGMISDGFRPTTPGVASAATPTTTSAAQNSTPFDSSSSSPPRPVLANRSSIAKPPRPHDSFSLRHDGGMGAIQERGGPARSSSVSTTSTAILPTETPYEGPSGPSHPYHMYAQNVRIARTMSVATTSTGIGSESTYTGPSGPSHPYGMYDQGTSGESSTPQPVVAAPIPAVFNGMPDQYHRRLGPDGEDIADIIGPDGHTEQLPPYTRYPDEVYTQKIRQAEQEHEAVGPTVGATVAGAGMGAVVGAGVGASVVANGLSVTRAAAIPGAGGLGLATRNPEFDGPDEMGSPQSRHSSRSFSSGASSHEINMAASGLSEKGKPVKRWQAWMTQRLFGVIPYWAICLTGGVLLLMGIILGTVIGTFLAKHKKPFHPGGDAEPDTVPTVTVTYDATPIATPSNLASLAVGTYGMPVNTNSVSSTCFNDTTQSQAWNCNLMVSNMYITISKDDDGSHDYSVSIRANESLTIANNVYSYGEQPPVIISPQHLELVNDTYEPNRGPAWFKMLAYNKTVIIPESFLHASSSSSSSKRSPDTQFDSSNIFKRKGVAQEGEKPWICTWPETFLELFIYPQQNSSWYRPPSSSAASTTTSSSASARTNYVVPAGSYSQSTMTASTATTTGPFGPIDTSANYPVPPPPYPKVLKMEERRVDGSPQPVCTQVEIVRAGAPARPVLDSSGNPITVTIEENEPPPPGTVLTGKSKKRTPSWQDHHPRYRRDGSQMSECGCMWFLT